MRRQGMDFSGVFLSAEARGLQQIDLEAIAAKILKRAALGGLATMT
jgi:hypothetical protein